MDQQQIEAYVREHAPGLDPTSVARFMAEHDKPRDEHDSHIAWAIRLLRSREEHGTGPDLDLVEEEMRRHDEHH